MTSRGSISHLDLNVTDPAVSIGFYGLLLEFLGWRRDEVSSTAQRCSWSITGPEGCVTGVEIRAPAHPAPRSVHERYSPGIDHLAFHASSRDDVDAVHMLLTAAGHPVADPPAEYGYSPGYYAVAFDDPDGIRLEVVHEPGTNP